MEDLQGRRRVVIENLRPNVDLGRFPIKRVIGDILTVEVDAFADGHDHLIVLLLHRQPGSGDWIETPMESIYNDRFRAQFRLEALGRYQYTVVSWIDRFHTWRHDLTKRAAAGQDLSVDLLIGADLVASAVQRAGAGSHPGKAADVAALKKAEQDLRSKTDQRQRVEVALDQHLLELMEVYADRSLATKVDPPLEVIVDPPLARFSAWYELFPRSCSPVPGKHGTFRDVISQLPEIAEMGFDILYMPPIHPIGDAFRKGKNNTTEAQADDVGSPWAIGSAEGGHKSILAQLGTLADFQALQKAAQSHGISLALDIAFQCSPDHPYVKSHPDWFRARPDGTIQYAENPPKKYQDIYPFDFECHDWQGLWKELRSVFEYWAEQGVRVFRVDNPHTKPFPFWEWCITSLKQKYPDLMFLAEAFTRPKIMYRLAKLGYTQSYTYFTWRNNKAEITEYFTELTQTDVREVFRPNLWPNTPDILNEFLQSGGPAAFSLRLVLATMLGANYGVYGPAYLLAENEPYKPGSEEYLNSEKYEIRQRDLDQGTVLRALMTRLNAIRRAHPALQSDWSLQFHPIDNDQMIAFSKREGQDLMLCVVNLNPHSPQAGWLELNTVLGENWGSRPIQVTDLLTDQQFNWTNGRAYIELDPQVATAHVFQISR
ncbi:MAG: alpha-1,4-glucan--maltose-1-phosphate maltosyltransferase [Planctomycetota bacterium]|nr:alpha-1,4-glucan--maltose-1-phosphate maltosyltransferase [Planctomycetota bacterium]